MEIERESQKARELAEREARKERLRLVEERLHAEGESFPPLQRMPSILDAYETPNWPPKQRPKAHEHSNAEKEEEKEQQEPMSLDSAISTPKNSTSSDSSPAKERECRAEEEESAAPKVREETKKLPLQPAKQQTTPSPPAPVTNQRPPANAKSNNNSSSSSTQQQQTASKQDPHRDERALNELLQSKVNTLEYLLFQKNNTIELHVVNTSRLASLCEQQRTALAHAQECYARLQEVLQSVEAQLASEVQHVSELETARDNTLNEFLASDREIERKIEQLETTISDQQMQIDSLTRQQQQLQLLSEQPAPPVTHVPAKSHPTQLQKSWPNVLESVCLGRNLPPPKYLYRRHIHTGMYLVTTEVNGLEFHAEAMDFRAAKVESCKKACSNLFV